MSTFVTGVGGILAGLACGTTAGLGCLVASGASILAADFSLNLAFDAWIKEDALQIIGLGREDYNQIIFHKIEY